MPTMKDKISHADFCEQDLIEWEKILAFIKSGWLAN